MRETVRATFWIVEANGKVYPRHALAIPPHLTASTEATCLGRSDPTEVTGACFRPAAASDAGTGQMGRAIGAFRPAGQADAMLTTVRIKVTLGKMFTNSNIVHDCVRFLAFVQRTRSRMRKTHESAIRTPPKHAGGGSSAPRRNPSTSRAWGMLGPVVGIRPAVERHRLKLIVAAAARIETVRACGSEAQDGARDSDGVNPCSC